MNFTLLFLGSFSTYRLISASVWTGLTSFLIAVTTGKGSFYSLEFEFLDEMLRNSLVCVWPEHTDGWKLVPMVCPNATNFWNKYSKQGFWGGDTYGISVGGTTNQVLENSIVAGFTIGYGINAGGDFKALFTTTSGIASIQGNLVEQVSMSNTGASNSILRHGFVECCI